MQMTLETNLRDDAQTRASFFALAQGVFGLSFEGWYRQGFWSDRYMPYALVENRRVVANVSVNRMTTRWQGESKTFVQIGTVMTDPAFRGRGFARRLMEAVLGDWQAKCDGMYLYANDTVLDFYPKFGFARDTEYVYTLPRERLGGWTGAGQALLDAKLDADSRPRFGSFAPLDMDSEAGRAVLRRCYRKGSPYTALPLLDNEGLLFFYCAGPLKDAVYYSARHDMAAVLEQEGATLLCHDFFGAAPMPLGRLLAELAGSAGRIELGFAPCGPQSEALLPICDVEPAAGDDALFVLQGKENPFRGRRLRMPSLSHA